MKIIRDLVLDEERALYNIKNTKIINIKFDGPSDGESALKECENIEIENNFFNLRYPLWHVDKIKMSSSKMTQNARAAIWYCKNIHIVNCELNGIKALRECQNVIIEDTSIESFEFGWKSQKIKLINTSIKGEYLFLDSNIINLENVELQGKYSFQYVNNLEINNSNLDTKDAFWHANNIVIKNSVLKGEYLGWYSNDLTLINCKIIGTQPLCYCKNLKLIDCVMENCDLSFENSEVNGNIIGYVESIKNPLSGTIVLDSLGELITDDKKYGCKGIVSIKKK